MTFCDGGDGGNFIPANQPTIQLFRFKIITSYALFGLLALKGLDINFKLSLQSLQRNETWDKFCFT